MKDEKQKRSSSSGSPLSGQSSSRNEFDFINDLRRKAAAEKSFSSSPITHHSSLVCGIGDDAAVLRQITGRNTVITADLLVEDIDFRRTATPPALLGHKALAVSLSDLAAMGARPLWALTSIGMPQDIWDSDFKDEFYSGFLDLAEEYDVHLIGGDVSRAEKIVIDSIAIGECADGAEVYRAGAKPGDQVFVTGSLGGAAAGLRLLERGADLNKEPDDVKAEGIRYLLLRHLRPEPRVGWGLVLGKERLATAMIDISDGLSSDLHRLCRESGVGALIDSTRIPVDSQVASICGRRALDPLLLSLHGGEDFELLFTISPENAAKLPRKVDGVSVTQIGEIKPSSEEVRLSEGTRVWKLEPGGWEHFKKE